MQWSEWSPFFSILHQALDWKVFFDSSENSLVIPPFLAVSTLRPDAAKKVVLMRKT